MANPSLNLTLRLPSLQNVGPGGRPPDTVPVAMDHERVLGDTSVQHESRSIHGELGDPDVGVIAGHLNDMILGSVDKEMHHMETMAHDSVVVTHPQAPDVNRGSSPTYARMVANNPSVVGKKVSDWRTDNDNVVVLEETCGVALHGLNTSVVNSDIVDKSAYERPSEPSAHDPYGPWMQVVSRFHKLSGSGTLGSRGKALPGGSDSRFDVLASEVEPVQEDMAVNGIVPDMNLVLVADSDEASVVGRKARMDYGRKTRAKIVASVDSNPDIRSKNSIPSMSNVQVVTSGATTGGKISKARGTVGHALNDGVRPDHLGVRIRKNNNGHHMPQPALFEWTQKFALELEAANMGPSRDLEAMVEDTGQGAMQGGNGIVVHDATVLDVSDGGPGVGR
ncbi:hypothetical protein V6N12_058785 [Hibiscus sabdariffa]|uniref:Uncharacterized protein n=1 Tax=Hibiscus sabdariffa TaxID=183260 RepID=A0ABR2ET65_9ROSI